MVLDTITKGIAKLTIKEKALVFITGASSTFIDVSLIPLIGLYLLVGIDFIMGVKISIKEARKTEPKKKVGRILTSGGFRQTWRKSTEYFFGILGFFVLDHMILGGNLELFGTNIHLAYLAIMVCAGIEIKSLNENLIILRGVSILGGIFKLIKSKSIEKTIDSLDTIKPKEDEPKD